MDNTPKWNGRKIVKDEDRHDLESRSAVFEFKHRMARPDAEHRAHHEYQQDKHKEAAAHHLQGLKAAQTSSNEEARKEGHKHGMMYRMHMEKLGHDPMGPVPHEIQGLADKQEHFYRFKAHRADAFLLQGSSAKEEDKGKLAKTAGYSMRDNLQQKGARPFKAGQSVYMTSHTGEKFPYTITSNEYKMMRYMDHDHPHVHVRSQTNSQDGGGWYPLAALHFEDGLAKADGKVLPFKRPAQAAATVTPAKVPSSWADAVKETAAAGPQVTDGVTSIAPRIEANKRQQRAKIEGIFADAHQAMAQDPGFQEVARQRETEAKKAKLKAGGQLFKPGQTVTHVDQEAIPWQGKVTSAGYQENDIDGPGHYYEVKWWNPKQKQYHEDYLHQDNLKPG